MSKWNAMQYAHINFAQSEGCTDSLYRFIVFTSFCWTEHWLSMTVIFVCMCLCGEETRWCGKHRNYKCGVGLRLTDGAMTLWNTLLLRNFVCQSYHRFTSSVLDSLGYRERIILTFSKRLCGSVFVLEVCVCALVTESFSCSHILCRCFFPVLIL